MAAAQQVELTGDGTVVGIFSYLAVADEPSRVETDEQTEAFTTAVEQAKADGPSSGCAPR